MTPTASITAHKRFDFRVDPYRINWGYNLRTHSQDTYGGKVVQILGVDLTTLSISTVAGAGGQAYVDAFMKFFRDMALWQQDTQKLATFSYPYKQYFLNVWALNATVSDQLGNVVYPIDMQFNIQEDLAGTLKKTAMTAELNRLSEGIGYTKSVYNYPTPQDIQGFKDSLAAMDTSSSALPPQAQSGATGTVTGTDNSLTAEQQSNAKAIIGVALSRNLGLVGAVAGIMTAFTESTLINVNHGDAAGPSSIGLFQQMPSWGPNRTDPASSAGYFFDRLVQISPTWTTLDPWIACQRVQQSEFQPGFTGNGSDGTEGWNYKQNYSKAQSICANLIQNPTGSSAGVVVTGASVTIPTNKIHVPPEIKGATVSCPNAAVAKGIAAGFAYLDTPYVWGGGDGIGSGPNDGVSGGGRGGGAENSGQGTIGFDCSGLTGYVVKQMGFAVAGGNSSSQKGGGTKVPYANAVCGDLLGYYGHITVYLGMINGLGPYLLEAPDVGMTVQIKAVYPTNGGQPHDSQVERYWN